VTPALPRGGGGGQDAAPVADPRALVVSFLATFGAFATTFFLYRRTLGGPRAAIAAMVVSVAFVVVFGVARRRLGRPQSGSPGFKEALFLGLTVAGFLLLAGWFAFAR
jgi:hypothetical protein